RVVLCVGHLGEMIREVVGDGGQFGLEVVYSFDGDRLLGTGGALRQALPLLGKTFFVLYGDSYLDISYLPPLIAFRRSGAPALMQGSLRALRSRAASTRSARRKGCGKPMRICEGHP